MTTFTVTWDYRCPFARNAHEHVVEGLKAGADWDVTFSPFSLGQVHVADGEPDVWDDETKKSGLLATAVGIAVRDRYPDKFLDTHLALFAARHDRALDIRERDVLGTVLTEQGLDAEAVLGEVDDGWPLHTFRKEHESSAAEHRVWGVPTFIAQDQAVFVRLMNRPHGDGELAQSTINRVVDLLRGWPELNEFKHTAVRR